MLSEKMLAELNKQITAEIYSAYLYLSMSASLKNKNFGGMSHWFKAQWREELSHGLKLFDFVTSQGGLVELGSIEKPKQVWETPLEAFSDALAHEKKVTGMINELVELSVQENDSVTQEMLKWFVKEQEEEEETASGVVEKIKNTNDIMELDNELGKRVFKD
jgi:ferritin